MTVFYLGIIRFSDRVCVAGYSNKYTGINEIDESAVVRILSDPNINISPGRNYTHAGDTHSISYVADHDQRIYAAITDKTYSSRVVFSLLDELRESFNQQSQVQVIDKSMTCKKNYLSKKLKENLKTLIKKYDDVRNVDTLAKVKGDVDVVTGIMHDNIKILIENNAELEDVADQARQLGDQAKYFEDRSHQLRRKMRCKNIKMNLMIGGIALIVFLIILIPIIIKIKAISGDGDDEKKKGEEEEDPTVEHSSAMNVFGDVDKIIDPLARKLSAFMN